jgi:succinate dehydrogenase / fumarate reductase, cytochrome b subunit
MNKFLTSSIGKKTVMALSGLFLIAFLLEHLYTNVHIFFGDGGVAFDEASHSMVHSILIRIIEVVLFLAIVVHVAQAIILTRDNSKARPVKYAVSGTGKTSPWISRNMGLTGSLIFFFIVVHLYNFFVPYRVTDAVGHESQLTLAQSVVEAFKNPWYSALYTISVIVLAFHISHGFKSAFQTLGMNNKKYTPIWNIASNGFAFLMGAGFAAFPILFYGAHLMGKDLLNWAAH